MTYIYDLILNWSNRRGYEFFEWNDDDEIEYVKKIPIFRINNFYKLIDNKIKIDLSFLKDIYNKTEVYGNHKAQKVDYACIFCNKDLSQALAIEFASDGTSLYKSNIYILDLEDIFNIGNNLKIINLNYQVLNNYENDDFYLTRDENRKKKVIISEVNSIYLENNIDKLKYIYYELFDAEIDNPLKMKDEIIHSLDNNFDYRHNNVYNFIKTPNYYKNI